MLEPTRFALDNGLKVLLLRDRAAPVVAFQAWVNVGSADEKPDEAGIAHVFEHMLFKGTAKRGVGQIAQEVEAAGGDINAFTSYDHTVYHLVLSARDFDTGLDILADAVQRSSFDPTELERELKVVLEELRQGEDSPGRVVSQTLFGTAFGTHPYGRPIIGSERTIKSFRRDKLLDFFRRWYTPANITFVVVGDFDPKMAEQKVRAAWSTPGAPPVPARDVRAAAVEPAQKKARAKVLTRDVRETHLALAFHIPGLAHEDTAALDVAAILVGQGDSSRLVREVKRNRELATEVHAYAYTPLEPGLFVAGATMPAGDPEPTLRAILGELYRLTHEDPTSEELAKAKAIIESESVYQKETVQGMARKLGFYHSAAGGAEAEAAYLARVRALTPSTVRAACARYLVPGNATVVALVPSEQGRGASAPAALEKRLLAAIADEAAIARTAHARPELVGDDVIRHVLPNGIRVLVKRDPGVPVVAFRAVWLGGQRAEDARTAGTSNLLAELVTRGTKSRTGDQLAAEVDGLAGGLGGFSGRNSFGVRGEFLAAHWERGIELLADVILHPAFPEEELEKARRVVLDELAARDDSLSSAAFRLFTETLLPRHPYRYDVLGTPASVAGITRRGLTQLYARLYPPGGLTISVVGDVEPSAVIGRLASLFPPAPGAPPRPPTPARDPVKRQPGGREVYRFLDRQQAHVVIGFPGLTLDDPDRHVLEVLSSVLSGQGGRLFVELRDKQGLAYRVSAFNVEGLDPGWFGVYIATSPENLTKAVDGIRAELARVVASPVTAAELARAKRYLAGAHDISLQRRAAVASTLAFSEAYGLGWDEYRRYVAAIDAVELAAVQRVAREVIDWDLSVMAIVKPEELSPGAAKVRAGERPPGKAKGGAKAKATAPRPKAKPRAKPRAAAKKKPATRPAKRPTRGPKRRAR